jgi:hypothetical protein
MLGLQTAAARRWSLFLVAGEVGAGLSDRSAGEAFAALAGVAGCAFGQASRGRRRVVTGEVGAGLSDSAAGEAGAALARVAGCSFGQASRGRRRVVAGEVGAGLPDRSAGEAGAALAGVARCSFREALLLGCAARHRDQEQEAYKCQRGRASRRGARSCKGADGHGCVADPALVRCISAREPISAYYSACSSRPQPKRGKAHVCRISAYTCDLTAGTAATSTPLPGLGSRPRGATAAHRVRCVAQLARTQRSLHCLNTP